MGNEGKPQLASEDELARRGGLLRVLDEDIAGCRKCESRVEGFAKPQSMLRGVPGRVMVIGEGPGRKEVEQRRAFSGQAGKRLDEWFIESGAPCDEPRRGVYLTSITKCAASSKKGLKVMTRECNPFLRRQLDIVRPELVITLGAPAFETMNVTHLKYEDALCRLIRTTEWVLVSPWSFDFSWMPWPHPSGLNRKLNDLGIQRRLLSSFELVGAYLT